MMRAVEIHGSNLMYINEDAELAVKELMNKFPPDDVYLYLFLAMDVLDDVMDLLNTEFPDLYRQILLSDETTRNMTTISNNTMHELYQKFQDIEEED